MWNPFREYREFLAWRECRTAVKFATRENEDRKAMADLVGRPGYTALKALMIATALTEMARHGQKSDKAAGLALAVGIIAQCEQAVIDLTEAMKTKGGE